ncbi:hypothetical protein FEM48_Zijuj06G0182700 [Ziziphus jujuba var. spinosa]|uniref:Uncharacterized protein n=1 Tax=Ziziphus jujuba var. spinosa TaxID=714518 RepID=A0A978VAV4_ZIZJJ|nr:hypothetical protein FEM48_Zijuj06G0182700 [Ziziphus jujuba var. spinosa]
MDHHDLKASEIEINAGNHCSPRKHSLLEKTNSLPDFCVGLTDANVGLQKQGHEFDCETSDCKAEKLPEIERNDHISSTDCAQRNMDDLCSEGGQPLDKNIHDKMNGYWLNQRENGLKFVMQAVFPDKQCKTESSSSNSTQVILPASSNDSCQETNASIASKHSKTNGMDTSTCTDFRSNLKESAFRSSPPGIAIYAPKAEPETSKILPGKIYNLVEASETPESFRARNAGKVLGMSSDNNYGNMEDADLLKPDLFKKQNVRLVNQGKPDVLYEMDDAVDVARRVAREVEQEVEASGSTSSVQGRNSETIHQSFVDSADSRRKSCLTENGSVIQQGNGQDKSISVCSTKDMDTEVAHKGNDGHHEQELSYLTRKAESLTSNEHTSHHSNLDLNEDILQYEVEYPEQSVKEVVFNPAESVSKPIPVVAKSGVSLCLPMSQVLKEGELGWRGSAATSAFRPTAVSKSWIGSKACSGNDSAKHSPFKGIDLNVAAIGVEFGSELCQEKSTPEKSSFPPNGSSMEESSSQARRFSFDLNCVSEIDNCQELSPPTSLSRNCARDFDLNNNPASADASVSASQPGEGTKSLRNSGLDCPAVFSVENQEQPEFRSFKSAFSAVNPFQVSHGHAQPFLLDASNVLKSNEQLQRVTVLQPKLNYTQQPPHAFLYSNGFCIDPKNSLPPTLYAQGVMPYLTDPHATTIFPQVLGSAALSAFSRSQHVVQVPDGSGPSDVATARPNVDRYNGMNAMDSGSRGANARQLSIPLSSSTVEEQMKTFQQVSVSAPPAKRREPEGGWDSHQVCFRQVASWK